MQDESSEGDYEYDQEVMESDIELEEDTIQFSRVLNGPNSIEMKHEVFDVMC